MTAPSITAESRMRGAWGRAIRALKGRLMHPGVGATVLRGSLGSFWVKVGGVGIGFGVQVLLARLLGPEAFGRYVYALTWSGVLTILGALGLNTGALRFVAAYEAADKFALVRGFVRSSFRLSVLASLAVTVAVHGVVWALGERVDDQLRPVLLAASWLVPVTVLLQLVASIVQALGWAATSQAVYAVIRPLLVGVAVAATVLFTTWGNATGAMVANLGATTAALGITWLIFRRTRPQHYRREVPAYRSREWVAVSLPLFLIAGFQIVLAQTDTIMLGIMVGTTEAGIYAVAANLATLVTFGITAANVAVAPMIARLYAQQRRSELQRMITWVSRGVLGYAVPAWVGLVALGLFVLGLYGPDFRAGYGALVVVGIGHLVISVCGSVGFLLTMTGHEREATWAIGGSAALNVVLNALLIPQFGMLGAATATAFVIGLRSVVLAVLVWKRLRISTTAIVFAE